jgi:hypothetical protein
LDESFDWLRINIEEATETCYTERGIKGVRLHLRWPYFLFRGQVKKYKSFSSREKQIWEIREKKIKAEEKNRKRHSLLQRKNEN